MKSMVLLAVPSFAIVALVGSSDARATQGEQDLCYVEVHADYLGNAQNPCDYRFTMTVNADGTIASSGGGTRECATAGLFSLGAGSGTAGSPSQIVFPNLADVRFDLPTEHQSGRWMKGLVHTLSDRGGSSPVTSSLMICNDAPK